MMLRAKTRLELYLKSKYLPFPLKHFDTLKTPPFKKPFDVTQKERSYLIILTNNYHIYY